MFVSSGVKYDLRFELLEHVFKSRTIQNIGNERNDSITESCIDQFLLNLKQLHFALLDQKQTLWLVSGNLPAKLTTDAAASASYHDDTAAEGASNLLAAELHLFAAQQILQFDRPQLTHLSLASGELVNRRDCAEFDLEFAQDSSNFRDRSEERRV